MEFVSESSAANEQPILKQETSTIESADASGINTTSVVQHVSTSYNFALAPTALEFKIDNFVNRWTKIDNGTLSNTDGPITSVWSGRPINMLLNNPAVAEKWSHYRYYRGTVEIMLVLSVPGNCSGLYALSAYPFLTKQTVSAIPRYPAHQGINGDHWALVTMESSTDVILSLPFFSDKDMQPTTTSERTADYEVHLFCYSPVKSAIPGGPSTASWTLYARFAEDASFHVPFYQGAPLYQGKKTEKLVSFAQKAKAEKTFSKTAGTIKDVAQKLTTVPLIGGVAATVASGAKIAEDVFGWLGFSRENAQQENQHFATRSVTNIVPVTGKDSCDVAGYDVANAIAIDPEIAGNVPEDQGAFASLAARWTLVDQFDFSVTNSPGDLVSRVYITPGYCMNSGTLTSHHYLTTAGYIGIPFSYWRADAEYLVVVPSAAVHRGTLQVVYAPTTGALGADPTNITLNSIFDISESSMTVYKVGYPVNEPMLPLDYWCAAATLQPTGTAAGTLAIRVVNPLQSPNPTDSVKCSVFVRFKNVQFAVPRYAMRLADHNGEFFARWPVALGYQGKLDVDEDVQQVELVPSNGVYAVKDIVSGEDILSARAMMQKPIRVSMNGGAYIGIDGTFIQFGYTRDYQDRRVRTAAFHYGKLFSGVAASQVIKITNCSNDNTAATCMMAPTGQVGTSSITTADNVPDIGPFTIIGPNKGAEFRIPWYSPSRIKPVDGRGNAGTLSVLREEDNVVLFKGYGHDVIGFYSFGDDIRLGPFCVTPTVYLPPERGWLYDETYPWLYDPNPEPEP